VSVVNREASYSGRNKGVTIFVIATNKYMSFAEDLIRSANSYVQRDVSVKFALLTDRVESAQRFLSTREKCDVAIEKIAPLGWPNATLMRFELTLKN